MAGSHILVQRLDRGGSRELSVLLVHVVGAGSRVVSQPNAKVLDLERVLLMDLKGNELPIQAKFYTVHDIPR